MNSPSSFHYTLIKYKYDETTERKDIIHYLNYNNIILFPKEIYIEYDTRKPLPQIICDGLIYTGVNEIISFYENASGISNILKKTKKWKSTHPDYKIKQAPIYYLDETNSCFGGPVIYKLKEE